MKYNYDEFGLPIDIESDESDESDESEEDDYFIEPDPPEWDDDLADYAAADNYMSWGCDR